MLICAIIPTTPNYVWRNGHHDVFVHYAYTNLYYQYTNVYYPAYGINPVATVAAAVVDSIAALGTIAT